MRFRVPAISLKSVTIVFAVSMAFFVTSLLVCVICHTTPKALALSMASPEIRFAINLSLVTSLISTLLCILVAVPSAYALARYDFFGKSLVTAMIDVPLALPPLVAGVGLLIVFGSTAFGHALSDMGVEFVFSPAGIVIAQFFVNMPFMFRVMRSTFLGLNPRFEIVAKTLGAGDFATFFRVTLPMSVNGLVAGAIITWSRGIGEFGAALMVAGATRMKTETLPIALYLNMSCGDLPLAIAAATILIFISVASLLLFETLGKTARLF